MLDLNALIILIVSFSVLFLSINVFIRKKNKLQNYLFGFLLVFYFIWTSSSFINHISDSLIVVDFCTKLAYVSGITMLAILALFSEVQNFNRSKFLLKLYAYILPSAIFSWIVFNTSWIVIGGTIRTPEETERVIPGDYFFVVGIFALVYLVITLRYFFKSFKNSKGVYRDQILYILIGTFISITVGVFTGIVLPLLGIAEYSHLTPLTSSLAVFFIYYAIFKDRFLDIRIFVAKFLEYTIYGFSIYFFVYFSYFVNNDIFGSMFTQNSYVLEIALVIAFIIFSKSIFVLSHKYINAKFDYESTAIQLNTLLGRELNPIKVADIFCEFIVAKFTLTSVSIFIKNENTYNMLSKYIGTEGINRIIDFPNGMESIIGDNKSVLIEDFLSSDIVSESHKDRYRALSKQGIEILLPIYFDNVLDGFVLIGGKKSGYGFSIQDIQLLENIITPFTLSLQRADLYVETQVFSETLQTKVNEATKQLKEQNKELEERYREERDMIGIMGHELRTPLTIGKGSVEYMMKKSRENPNVTVAELARQMEAAYSGFKREAAIVETLLTASHLDNNNLEIVFEEVNIAKITENVINDNLETARSKSLKLEFHPIENIPTVKCQSNRAQEILDNLISNAIKYTKVGRIDVFMRKDEEFVYIDVQDTGEGIAPEDLPNIGKKFFRAHKYLDSAQTLRPGGNGIGAYVTKGILTASGGDLLIQSKLGVGSTFTAKLPIFIKEIQTVEEEPEENEEKDMFVKLGLAPKI